MSNFYSFTIKINAVVKVKKFVNTTSLAKINCGFAPLGICY